MLRDPVIANSVVEYSFTNRTPEKKLNPEAVGWLTKQIQSLESLSFSEEEIQYMESTLPHLPKKYLEYLRTFKLNPKDQVEVIYDTETQDLQFAIHGLWVETILYEIPILALISEAYFHFVDTDWNYDGQVESAAEKARQLLSNGCTFSEFGTRRRRSLKAQRLVIEGIVKGAKEIDSLSMITGTSNVMFAKEFGLKPVGTVAHEWMMGIAAYSQDYTGNSRQCMDLWLKTFGTKAAGFALTDTFGSTSFLKDFVPPYTDYYIGVRQDSGDPEEYTKLVADHYRSLGYAPNTKMIIFSDSLNVEKCIKYKQVAQDQGLIATFGVGTFFTNDFTSVSTGDKSTPLNIVIKLSRVNGQPAIKISDNISKNTGDSATVTRVKKELGYVEKEWAEGDESKRW